jgi:hypothetical protein
VSDPRVMRRETRQRSNKLHSAGGRNFWRPIVVVNPVILTSQQSCQRRPVAGLVWFGLVWFGLKRLYEICSVWKLFTESSARILSWVWRTVMETFTRKTVPTEDSDATRMQIAITEVGFGELN